MTIFTVRDNRESDTMKVTIRKIRLEDLIRLMFRHSEEAFVIF